MRAEDLPAYAKMRHSLWPAASVEEHRLELTVSLARKELRAFVAETSESELVGFAEASVRAYANGCEEAPVPFVEGLWVEEELRRREVGRYLMEAVVSWARDAGYRELGSDCELSNEGSRLAHLAWDFEETERVVYFRRRL